MKSLALVLLVALLSCCRSDDARSSSASSGPAWGSASSRPGEPAVVSGTVVDASTGEPVAGALVRGPNDARARTDSKGRFELEGLASGVEGELVGEADGRRGTLRLRPLRPGRLEVVLHLVSQRRNG